MNSIWILFDEDSFLNMSFQNQLMYSQNCNKKMKEKIINFLTTARNHRSLSTERFLAIWLPEYKFLI